MRDRSLSPMEDAGDYATTTSHEPPSSAAWFSNASSFPLVGRLCALVLGVAIGLYAIAYSSLSIARYRTGQTLFDLAAFEQGFWNATKGTLFFYSLEGDMSRFGRHFSPIFYLLLPIYAVHRQPTTLLVLQSVALALAAVPLYLFTRHRLGSPVAALLVALLYLANPAIHDVNTVNDFHELAFVVVFLFLAFYAIETEHWWLYALSVVGALCVKEDVALVVSVLGLYVFFVARHRRIGAATFIGGIVWFVVVVQIVMPALRGSYGPVPFPGYDYLGHGIFGFAHGILTKPGTLWHIVSAAPKRAYLYWLFLPVAFLALLAPEVLVVAIGALLIILASNFPPTYVIFAQYVAPIVPIVFVAAVVGIDHIRRLGIRLGVGRIISVGIVVVLLLAMATGTIYAQTRLQKYPTHLVYTDGPDPEVAAAMALVRAIPSRASLVIEDNRWLSYGANRRYLYFLSGTSPEADYVIVNQSLTPITNVPQALRTAAIQRIVASQQYLVFQCTGGFTLYARKAVYRRDTPHLACSLARSNSPAPPTSHAPRTSETQFVSIGRHVVQPRSMAPDETTTQ